MSERLEGAMPRMARLSPERVAELTKVARRNHPTLTALEDVPCICGKCGGEAHITPIGCLCLRCTFGKAETAVTP